MTSTQNLIRINNMLLVGDFGTILLNEIGLEMINNQSDIGQENTNKSPSNIILNKSQLCYDSRFFFIAHIRYRKNNETPLGVREP